VSDAALRAVERATAGGLDPLAAARVAVARQRAGLTEPEDHDERLGRSAARRACLESSGWTPETARAYLRHVQEPGTARGFSPGFARGFDAELATWAAPELPTCSSCLDPITEGGVKDGDDHLCLRCGGEA
jgi:hypothetical protein